mmetsp:Transcript_34711/g.55597  ORF Transcript_34711/g.55597 Transcript_34711/m.55597 type:complete len:891 (+) Transcript_34711:104-2776(+)
MEHVNKMEQMLLQMNVPNTEIVKQAEKEITNAIKSKQCVPVFLQLLRFSQHQSVRQLSAVLLRLRVSKFWTELDGQTRNTAKELVLDALANEQSRIVSLNTMHVVASICTHEIQEAGWDSLLQFMHRCAVSSAPQQQELAMLLFYTLTGSLSQLCGDSFGQVKDLYMHVLQNSADPRVQVAALKASAALLNFHCDSEDVLAFQEFVPLILRGLAGNYNDDVLAVQLITIIGQIAECPMPIINTHIKETVELFLRIVSAAEVDEGTKQVAATTLVTLLECKTRFLMKQGLIPQVLNVSIMALAQDFQHFSTILGRQELSQAEMDAQKGQDDEQDDDNFLGRNLVGAIAEHCPARVIFSPMAEKAFQLMESNKMVNGEVPEQWMGLILLSTIIEFLTEEFSKPAVLEQLLLRTVPLAQNSPNVLIRVSALMVLSECVQFLGPSIFSYMPDMLPPAIQLMNDPKIAVKSCACDLLELICDDIEEDKILPYFDQLVNQLLVMVETAHNTSMQSTALCALSSLMVTTGPKFMPYFDSTCKKLSQFVSTTDESLLPVRGYAMAAFGNLALAASRPISEEEDSEKNNLALFAPLVQDILVCAQQGLEFEDMELSRNTYVMLGSLSEAFGEQIGNFINPIVDMLIIGLETNDQEEINCKDLDGAMVPEHLRDRFAGEDDDEDDDEEEEFEEGVFIMLDDEARGRSIERKPFTSPPLAPTPVQTRPAILKSYRLEELCKSPGSLNERRLHRSLSPIRRHSSEEENVQSKKKENGKNVPQFNDLVKRSTRFSTAVPAREVLERIRDIVEQNPYPLKCPYRNIAQKLSVDYNNYTLDVMRGNIKIFTVRIFLIKAGTYMVEFIRGQANIFEFKQFYDQIRQRLSEIVKNDYTLAMLQSKIM